MDFIVPSMSCGGCVASITNVLKGVDPQAQVQVDLTHKRVTVQSTHSAQELAAALQEAGYPPDA